MAEKKFPYGYGLSLCVLFRLYLRRISLSKWSLLLFLLGFGLLFLFSKIRGPITANNPANWVDSFVIAFAFFAWGCVGFLWAYRREAIQGLGVIRGTPAFILGLLLMVSGWGLALYGLLLGVKRIFGF
ncbi:MAG: hypothetical protein L0Z70_10745 [Chloroflexi bacterium]|nr:hypothetical protein [Chloroflexota bacterium]